MNITKANLTKDKTVDGIGLSEQLEDRANREHKGIKCDWIAHEDLIHAFERLLPHVALICEQPEAMGLVIPDINLGNYEIKSFTIFGEDDQEGITISATRELENGLTLPLNTPPMRWDHAYPHMEDLNEAVYNLREEVKLYYDGKAAPKRQLEMFAENLDPDHLNLDDEGVTLKVITEEKPKRKKVTKVE